MAMTRDKFKLIHSELIMQVQTIEHDLKLIYAGMLEGDFDENLDLVEKANLGTTIMKLKQLDYSVKTVHGICINTWNNCGLRC